MREIGEEQMGEPKVSKTSSEVILALKDSKKLMSAAEIKEKGKIENWNTLQWNLNKLEQIGRVHTELIGTRKYYTLNGKGIHQHSIKMDKDNYLWVDIFEPRILKEHFVRIKQTQKTGPGMDDWETKGTVIITRDIFDELLHALNETKKILEKEYWSEEK